MRLIWIVLGIFVLLMGCTLSITTHFHEQAHYQNCLYSGGKADTTYSMLGLGGATTCNTTGMTAQAERERVLVDGVIEGFGYQTLAFYGSVLLVNFFTLVVFLAVLDKMSSTA